MRQFAIKCISTLVGLTTFDTVISTLEVKDLPLKVSWPLRTVSNHLSARPGTAGRRHGKPPREPWAGCELFDIVPLRDRLPLEQNFPIRIPATPLSTAR